MKIDTITCSDPREDTPPEKLVAFMNEFPNVEVAVQATPSKIGPGLARRAWFEQLLHLVRNNPVPLKLAMHVNMEYCDRMCTGQIPQGLREWFNARRINDMPVIRRWQINYSGSKTQVFDPGAMAEMIINHPNNEFIMQHNPQSDARNVWPTIRRETYRVGRLWCLPLCPRVSVLYDASGGNGKSPEKWLPPYEWCNTGYSGGLRPENVTDELHKIAAVADGAHIWIDAEGGLKTPGTKTFDFDRARDYVRAANNWNKQFGR